MDEPALRRLNGRQAGSPQSDRLLGSSIRVLKEQLCENETRWPVHIDGGDIERMPTSLSEKAKRVAEDQAYGRVAASPTFEYRHRRKERYPFSSKITSRTEELHMMNNQEFTEFLNSLRTAYDLPPRLEEDSLMAPREDMDAYEDVLTEEDCASLQQRDTTLS